MGLPSPVPTSLALEQLQAIAEEDNPTLSQAAMAIEAARGRYLQVGLYPNPVVGYAGEEIGDAGTAGKQGAFIGQEFVTGGKLERARAVAAHEIEQARHAYEAQRRRVLNDVRAGFFEVLIAERSVALIERMTATGRESVKTAERLLAAQEVSKLDTLQSRIESETLRLRLHRAEGEYDAAWRRLAAVIGRPEMERPALAGDPADALPQLTWEQSLGQLLAESPELAQAQVAAQRAACALSRECAERIPNVQVQAGVQHDNATGDDVANLSVGMPLPVFNRNQGNISRARAEWMFAVGEVRRVELALTDRLAAAFQEYTVARNQMNTYAADILPSAKEAFDLVRKGYEQGELDYLRLLTAQRTYFEVTLGYLESLARLRSSSVNIEGLLLRGGLENASRTSQ